MSLTNFYRRFIKRFSHIAASLNDMLKKSELTKKHDFKKRKRRNRSRFRSRVSDASNDFLTSATYKTFQCLRDAFLEASVLRHFDSSRHLRIETDASNKTVSAILSQQNDEEH